MPDTISDAAADVEADARAVLDHLITGRPLDEDVYRRVRARAERITEEIRQAHGERAIAVDLVRESRDDA